MSTDLTGRDHAPLADPAGSDAKLQQREDQYDQRLTESGADTAEDLQGDSSASPLPNASNPLAQPSVASGRRLFSGLAPAALLLPLAVLSLAIYLWKPGWLPPSQLATGIPLTEAGREAMLPPISEGSLGATPSPSAVTSAEELEGSLARAQALVWESKFEEAINIYEELVPGTPSDARPHLGWARALLLDGLPDQALSHARLALTLEPTDPEASIALAQAYASVGDKARALVAAQEAVGLDGQNAEAHAVLARAYLLHGHFDRALEEANLALSQEPTSAEAHRVRGDLYRMVDGDLAAAIRELQRAAQLQPRLWLRHYDLGMTQLQAEDYDAATVALTEAWVLRQNLLTYGALGQAYYRLGQYDRAASYLEQSLSVGAWNGDTYALLASIHAQRGRCGDAVLYADQALLQDPNHPLALQAIDTCQVAGSPPLSEPTSESVAGAQGGAQGPFPTLSGRIAFPLWNLETGQYDTYLANADGSERALVVEGMHQPAFSPDGQWLSVNGERPDYLNLFLVRPDGSQLQEVTDHVEDGLPSWSLAPQNGNAEGLSLAFSSTRHGDKQSRIYILDRIFNDGQKAEARALNSGSDDVRGEFPAWIGSADQSGIVYSGCHYDGASAQCGLMLVSSELGPQTPQPLTDHPQDTAPAPHNSRTAFMSNRDGNWEIYLVERDGSGLKRLTHNASNDGLPTWSPDGQTIAFVSDEGGVWAVWAVRPDGSQRRQLFLLGRSGLAIEWQRERISWAPTPP